MEEEVRKELIGLLDKALNILKTREKKDVEELQELSEEAIEGVALHKNLDLISVTVLIYSLYKVVPLVRKQDYQDLLEGLQEAGQSLRGSELGRYNSCIRKLFAVVRKSDTKVKVHLHDIMHAARIKKGTALLERGLSIGQAAGLMGLSNWDLQQYAGRTRVLERHHEKIRARCRLKTAFKLFGI